MSPEELEQELERGRLRPAYLVAGDEPLLRDDAVAALRSAVLEGASADFNFDRLPASSTSPAALRDALRVLPVMARRRLVWLRDPEESRAGGRALLDALPEVVAEIATRDDVVLLVTAAKIDRRERWVKAFSEPAALVPCEAPRDARGLAAFVRAEAKRQGLSLEPAAAELLAERIGPQLLALRQEIAKAGLLAYPEKTITRGHVERTAIDVAEEPIWDLTDAIGEGRAGDALATLGRLLRGGSPPPVVLASLASHFRRLARVRSGARLAAPPFVLRKLEAQARRYAPQRLVAHLEAIHRTDEALKGKGALPAELALERLVLGLAA
ncbi:MAG TPA: DNA polymerase III subunit delta [Myxococcota bacterium]|nr:DNA polymerase III subunit delta [Myxococcota bacterium]